MKFVYYAIFMISFSKAAAQELYVFTEPASNMAAKSIGLRLNNYLMKETGTRTINYHLVPEVMWGVSKKIMVHAEAFFSNRNERFVAEGGGFYFKYRFLSKDDVHSHFRAAAFGRVAFNNSGIHEETIDLNGHNTGYESGIVATQLVNKIAGSASVSFLHAFDNGKEKFPYDNKERNAVNYTLSVGKLMLPKEYTSYKQTNMNLMLELLGQSNLRSGKTYLDAAPSVQFIFNSRIRFDAGYRYPLIKSLQRTSPKGVLLRLEYNIFNVS